MRRGCENFFVNPEEGRSLITSYQSRSKREVARILAVFVDTFLAIQKIGEIAELLVSVVDGVFDQFLSIRMSEERLREFWAVSGVL